MNQCVYPLQKDEKFFAYKVIPGELQAVKRELSQIDFQITRECNTLCAYREPSRMQFKTAMKGLNYLSERLGEQQKIYIGFYGGDAFSNFTLVRKITIEAIRMFKGREIRFSLMTKGTSFDPLAFEFLMEYNFNLLISPEIPRDLQNTRLYFENIRDFLKQVNKSIKLLSDYFPRYAKYRVQLSPRISSSCNICRLEGAGRCSGKDFPELPDFTFTDAGNRDGGSRLLMTLQGDFLFCEKLRELSPVSTRIS